MTLSTPTKEERKTMSEKELDDVNFEPLPEKPKPPPTYSIDPVAVEDAERGLVRGHLYNDSGLVGDATAKLPQAVRSLIQRWVGFETSDRLPVTVEQIVSLNPKVNPPD
jgi:hypothetical protein